VVGWPTLGAGDVKNHLLVAVVEGACDVTVCGRVRGATVSGLGAGATPQVHGPKPCATHAQPGAAIISHELHSMQFVADYGQVHAIWQRTAQWTSLYLMELHEDYYHLVMDVFVCTSVPVVMRVAEQILI
jgi:hypothetical protein